MISPEFEMPTLDGTPLYFLKEIPIFFIIFIIFFVVYVIVSFILMYHWSAYGMRRSFILTAETVFVLVSLFLFIISFLSLNYI